ncbi:protein of unknown function DUF3310 [Vibrio phage 1.118.B._10N.261.49.F6]|nr:protein of unknown function DUF3310 [Vibrio phage 1.118.A._10N.261.49.F6]AUR88920.1 protein of unknown function DUF3310 [Vibrio phage 1.118.B._10N.261.49.F6]AUR97121.1 protein of unknown function DUF3310 [Vibrio phage 1.237.A._10N.261.52.C5]AUR97216.1 protein of unknown function DUF3310 [Vibrio phage 1.237.B._10N.261.52.C5]
MIGRISCEFENPSDIEKLSGLIQAGQITGIDNAGNSAVIHYDTNVATVTVDQRVTAARFDQAATDRQVGGDHYKSLKIQPIEYIDANNMPYLEGNVVKYVTRHASKNGIQDIDKAIHYLELIKQMRYAEETTSE